MQATAESVEFSAVVLRQLVLSFEIGYHEPSQQWTAQRSETFMVRFSLCRLAFHLQAVKYLLLLLGLRQVLVLRLDSFAASQIVVSWQCLWCLIHALWGSWPETVQDLLHLPSEVSQKLVIYLNFAAFIPAACARTRLLPPLSSWTNAFKCL